MVAESLLMQALGKETKGKPMWGWFVFSYVLVFVAVKWGGGCWEPDRKSVV